MPSGKKKILDEEWGGACEFLAGEKTQPLAQPELTGREGQEGKTTNHGVQAKSTYAGAVCGERGGRYPQ